MMKVIITFTFCCDNLWKSKFIALENSRNSFLLLCGHPGKLRNVTEFDSCQGNVAGVTKCLGEAVHCNVSVHLICCHGHCIAA